MINKAFMALAFVGVSSTHFFPSPQANQQAFEHAKFTLPEVTAQVDVLSLGEATDPSTGKQVEGFAIIKRKHAAARPGGGSAKPGKNTCYAFMANGAKWKVVEPWMVNPANTSNLDESYVYSNLGQDIATWETAAGKNILGDGTSTTATLAADTTAPDAKNEVYFADIDDSGVIGVTIVWGRFGGPIGSRELLEWDQVYDDVDFAWASGDNPDAMIFGNIATHELGHTLGLSDLYTAECSQETMYGYAGTGETQKTTLNPGDVAGIRALYK